MSIDTTFLRRCTQTLETALGEIEKHREAGDVLYDICHAACVKEFELVREKAASCCASASPHSSPVTGRLTGWLSRTSSAMPRGTG